MLVRTFDGTKAKKIALYTTFKQYEVESPTILWEKVLETTLYRDTNLYFLKIFAGKATTNKYLTPPHTHTASLPF